MRCPFFENKYRSGGKRKTDYIRSRKLKAVANDFTFLTLIYWLIKQKKVNLKARLKFAWMIINIKYFNKLERK